MKELRHIAAIGIGAVFALALAIQAQAAPIVFTHSTSAGTLLNTTGISTFTTAGDDMDGMLVTAYFSTGGIETVAFATTGIDAGAATGSGWSLSLSGPTTFSDIWFLATTTASLDSLVINAAPGDTLFDYIFEFEVTPNSARGGPGDPSGPAGVESSIAQTADFLYSNAVSLNNVFYGDLYGMLTITFSGPLTSDSLFQFITDTDNVATPGDIKPIPEPATLLLLGTGLVAAGLRRRRTRSAS